MGVFHFQSKKRKKSDQFQSKNSHKWEHFQSKRSNIYTTVVRGSSIFCTFAPKLCALLARASNLSGNKRLK